MLPDKITDDIEREDEQIISQSFVMFPSTGQTLYLNGVSLSEMRTLYESRVEKGMWPPSLRPAVEKWANEHPETVTLIETRD